MARSKANIWNRTLVIIGGPNQSSYIQDPDNDKSDQAIWMRNFWEDDVDFCIKQFDWKELRKYEDLVPATDTVEKANWGYAYNRPDDCLVIRALTSDGDRTQTYPYEELGDYILSDLNTGYLKFTKQVNYNSVELFSVELANLIAAKLAVDVAGLWKPEMVGVAESKYAIAYDQASSLYGLGTYVEKTEQWADI